MTRIQIRALALACLSIAVTGLANAACPAPSNTCLGQGAGESNVNGAENTAVGLNALKTAPRGTGNTAFGAHALEATGLYDGLHGDVNTAFGQNTLATNRTGDFNVAIGGNALLANTTGSNNIAIGFAAMDENISGTGNVAAGTEALISNTSGSVNTAIGTEALVYATSGTRNVALGWRAGFNIAGAGSDNITIGASSQGAPGDNGVIRLGNKAFQKKTFIAGIRGVKTGLAAAIPVFIDANGQLGTVKSSARYKQNVQDLGSVSNRLAQLRPVQFEYIEADDDGAHPVQYGLIAEEVTQVMPELVVYGDDGLPETVAYHTLSVLLLNELQKERREQAGQAARIDALERQVQKLMLIGH